jgi:hypothetical protein
MAHLSINLRLSRANPIRAAIESCGRSSQHDADKQNDGHGRGDCDVGIEAKPQGFKGRIPVVVTSAVGPEDVCLSRARGFWSDLRSQGFDPTHHCAYCHKHAL